MGHNLYSKTIVDDFYKMCSDFGDMVAVIQEHNVYTYNQLDEYSTKIAESVVCEIEPSEEFIGVMIPRGYEYISSILGIWKLGCAFLPIDYALPRERIKYMLNNSGCNTLLVNKDASLDWLPLDIKIINVDDLPAKKASVSVKISPKAPAYIIYTSGTTGTPKGVVISHQALFSFSKNIVEELNFVAQKRILAVTSISFDISLLELIVPLTLGMGIVVADEKTSKNPRLLASLIFRNRIQIIQMTPSMMQQLLDANDKIDWLISIESLLIGGETFPLPLLQTLQKVTKSNIYNLYGPTETTIWTSISNLTNKNDIDIGKGFPTSYLTVVNDNLCESNDGVGEIVVGGEQLSDGYYKLPELTSDRFVLISDKNNELYYRTGDIGKKLEDGSIVFLGRKDNQVKIRGHRVELDEITHWILKFPGIKNAITLVMENKCFEKFLRVYYVSEYKIDISSLKKHLQGFLVKQVIPAEFISIEHIPLTYNGKIDKAALEKQGDDYGHAN